MITKEKPEKGSIKWQRAGRIRKAHGAANKVQKMKEILTAEAYSNWKPGQLLEVVENISHQQIIADNYSVHTVNPQLDKGDIILYLGWFENELWNFMPTVFTPQRVTGPKWLIGERVYLFVIDPRYLVEVNDDNEEENEKEEKT